jgi:TolB-like protein/Flp pilus assembly protein TadD
MKSFLAEIKRRKVFQVAVAYAVVAWLVVQVVAVVSEPLRLPDWLETVVIVLLVAGFAVAIVLAWVFDLTTAGVVRTPSLATATPATPASDGLMQLAGSAPAVTGEAVRPGGQPPRVLRNSVAVLPLENLSPNPDDAHFAAGIHEEILNYLAKIRDLSVIARTSVKRYAGSDKSIAEIAAELGVGTIMEGSVRYAGDRVRVTAQLIDAATEEHLWSEVYERNLADVFAIQVDIAEQIARALEAEFSAAERENIETSPTTVSSDAHALYLQSQALFAQGDTAIAATTPPGVRSEIQSRLDRVIALDPNFASAYAMKALLCAISRIYDPIDQKDWLERCAEIKEAVDTNAGKALELSDNIGMAYFALALHEQLTWHGKEAHAYYQKALSLQPNDSNILGWYSVLKWSADEFEDAIRLGEKAVSLDPSNAWVNAFLGNSLHAAGDYRASIELHEKAAKANPSSMMPYLLRALPEHALGNDSRAVKALNIANELMPEEASPGISAHVAYGYRNVGQEKDANRLWNRVEQTLGDRFYDPALWVWVYRIKGDRAGALKALRKAVEQPQYRQEIFLRTFLKQNTWHDPVLEELAFAELRSRLR